MRSISKEKPSFKLNNDNFHGNKNQELWLCVPVHTKLEKS